jgi:hypothetical protein
VRHVVELAATGGREIAKPNEARGLLGLPERE